MSKLPENRFQNNLDIPLDKNYNPPVGQWGIPKIRPEPYVPGLEFISFDKAATSENLAKYGVHFFLDDYRFERIWKRAHYWTEFLTGCAAVLSPDFSMFADWPPAMQLYNHYRKHFMAALLQEKGARVYPTIGWADEKSFTWCFDGEPVGGCVAVSSVGTQKKPEARKLFAYGFDAMLERLRPTTVLFYGKVPDECAKRANIVPMSTYYDNLKEVLSNG